MKELVSGSQIINLFITLGFLSVLYLGLHLLKKKMHFPAEISRKLVHISLGLTTLTFPFIFNTPAIVWAMCLISIVSLLALRYTKLKDNLGESLHGVDRKSYGEILFPLSVAILFQLSHTTSVFYIISVLVLTLADALAAVIGVYYGKAHYSASEGIKSFEGSFFFFITAFLCIQIPLLLMSDFPNANIILVAAFIALLITLCEAVSWQGLDNLFIPLGVYVTLTNYLNYQISVLILLSLVLTGIIVAGVYLRNRSTMNLSALLFSIVLGFLYVTLDPFSFVIPLSMFILYSYIIRKEQKKLENKHTVLTILYLNMGGLFWVFLRNNGNPDLAFEFSVYYCIQIGIISWIHQYCFHKKFALVSPVINAILLFTVTFGIYACQMDTFTFNNYVHYLIYMVLCLLVSMAIFITWGKKYTEMPMTRQRLIMQGGSAFLGSLLFYLIRTYYA